MKKIALGLGLIAFGLVFIICNKKWAQWVYDRTQRRSYSFASFLISEQKYEKWCTVFNRCGIVFWGVVLVIAGCFNLFYVD
jgi:hypothetical protein